MSRYHLTKAILYFMEAMLFFLKHSCLDTEDESCCQTFGSILLTSMAYSLPYHVGHHSQSQSLNSPWY